MAAMPASVPRNVLKQDRPKITKSNIVRAEPMAGENEMLKEFVADLRPKGLGAIASRGILCFREFQVNS